jgi:alcohol-forming fatty acyl-CoA reductase
MALDDLGITASDRKLLVDNVDVIFHCAALVSFDSSLLDILKVNVAGTHRLLELATEMKQLRAFTFVSTAFSQSYQLTLQEKHYPTGIDLPKLLQNIQTNDSELTKALEKKQDEQTSYQLSRS